MQRLLLVEFVNIDMHPGQCGLHFPFLQTLCQQEGVQTRWVRFGIRAGVQYQRKENGIGLSPQDIGSLMAEIRNLGAEHVLFSESISPSLIQAMKTEAHSVLFEHLDTANFLRDNNISSLKRWLGIHQDPSKSEPPDGPSLFSIKPDYSFVFGNELASNKEPIANIFAGPECLYRTTIEHNAYYGDVDLRKVNKKTGCAFCVDSNSTVEPGPIEYSIEKAIDQTASAFATFPRNGQRIQYVVHGANIVKRMDLFAARLADIAVDCGDFLFSCRTRDVVNYATAIESAIQLLAPTGHTINFHLIGLENFSQRELDRLNKGTTTVDNVKCIQILQRWEQRFSNSFFFRKFKGLSTILFTPWTTLSDLRFNLKMVEVLNIGDALGKFLSSKLRLTEGTPITELAKNNNLTIKQYDDNALDISKRTMYPAEIPWRFEHPAVETVARIAARIVSDESLENDMLYRDLRRFIKDLPADKQDSFFLFSKLLETLKDDQPAPPIEMAIDAFKSKVIHSKARGSATYDKQGDLRRPNVAFEGLDEMQDPKIEIALSSKGIKPVWKIEGFNQTQLEKLEQSKTLSNFPHRKARESNRDRLFYTGLFDLFLSLDRRNLEQAIEYTRIIEESRDAEKIVHAISQIGILLGYPSCCSHAYATQSVTARNRDAWLLLRRRTEEPGEIHWLMNPFHHAARLFASYIPCSNKCTESFQLLNRIVDVMCRSSHVVSSGAIEELSKHPFLFLLDELAYVELVPVDPGPFESQEGHEIFYRPGIHSLGTGRIGSVLHGNRLIIEPGRVTVFDGESYCDSFDLEATVWWYKRCYDQEFWKILTHIALFEPTKITAPKEYVSPMVHTKKVDLDSSQLSPLLSQRFQRICSLNGTIGDFRISQTSVTSETCFQTTLSRDNHKVIFFVRTPDSVSEYYMASKNFALQYDNSTPIDNEKKEQMASFLVEYLE